MEHSATRNTNNLPRMVTHPSWTTAHKSPILQETGCRAVGVINDHHKHLRRITSIHSLKHCRGLTFSLPKTYWEFRHLCVHSWACVLKLIASELKRFSNSRVQGDKCSLTTVWKMPAETVNWEKTLYVCFFLAWLKWLAHRLNCRGAKEFWCLLTMF